MWNRESTHSFPEFIRMGWKLPEAGTPLTTWQLDKPQPMESIWGWPVAGMGGCCSTGYPIGRLLTALQTNGVKEYCREMRKR